MADYKEWCDSIRKDVYHEGEWQWQEGEYTVTRTNHWSPPGCHNSCGVLYYTKNGKLEKIEGDPLNPFNNGKLCMRCLDYVEQSRSSERLKWPMKRVGERGENKWERITWDEAYDIIVEKVNFIKENYGGHTIIGAHGTGRNIGWQVPYFYHSAFDTPNLTVPFFSGFACYLPRVLGCAATMGDFCIVDASEGHEDRWNNPEYVNPECIVIWGNEPLKSNADGFLGHWLVKCVQNGSKIICIDPRLTWWAARAEYWLPIRPGTDTALGLAFINTIITEDLYDHDFVENWTIGFEELAERAKEYPAEKVAEICHVSSEKIKGAARLYAKSKPAAIQWGLAFDQQKGAMQTCFAATCLMGLTGNIDNPGGNILVRNAFNTHRHYNCGEENLSPGREKMKLTFSKVMEGSHMNNHASSDRILECLETDDPYKIRMMWIQSSNPLACPAQDAARCYEAMKKIDFIVVADPFMTPTAVACADLVLPIAMNHERNSVRTWWTPMRAITKVSSYYEAKSDEELIVELGRRLNPAAFPFKDDKEFCNWYITKDGDYPGTWEDVRNKSWVYWDFDSTYYKYKKGLLRSDGELGFNTTSGKFEFTPALAYVWDIDPLPYHSEPPESPYSTPELYKEYPLILTTGGRSYEYFHSEHRQMPTMREFHPEPLLTMHPDTAKKYGIKDGDWVWIETRRGRCKQKAKLFVGISPEVVHAEHGWWYPEKEAAAPSLFGLFESNTSLLTENTNPGEGGVGAPIKCLLCKIYKAE